SYRNFDPPVSIAARIFGAELRTGQCRVRRIHHAAISIESKWISERLYLPRIFFSFGSNSEDEKNPGMAVLRAFAATSSDGGAFGFMVRSQLLKQIQTSAV